MIKLALGEPIVQCERTRTHTNNNESNAQTTITTLPPPIRPYIDHDLYLLYLFFNATFRAKDKLPATLPRHEHSLNNNDTGCPFFPYLFLSFSPKTARQRAL